MIAGRVVCLVYKKLPNCGCPSYICTSNVQEIQLFHISSLAFGLVPIFWFSSSSRCVVISYFGLNLHFSNDQSWWTSFLLLVLIFHQRLLSSESLITDWDHMFIFKLGPNENPSSLYSPWEVVIFHKSLCTPLLQHCLGWTLIRLLTTNYFLNRSPVFGDIASRWQTLLQWRH